MPKTRPMLATAVEKPFDSDEFVFEIKWDGFRALGEVQDHKVSLYSRNLNNFNKFPSVVEHLSKVNEDLLFDGEIIAYDSGGKPSFQALQDSEKNNARLEYIIFDLLYLNGKKLLDLELIERKKLLQKILKKYPKLVYSEHIQGKGINFFKQAVKKNLEGIIGKRKNSKYLPGKRSESWLKIKHHKRDEAIIAGFTKPRGSRQYFGSLVLGQYRNADKLTFIGHTGTGFDESQLSSLYKKMIPLKVKKSPFKSEVPLNSPITWIKPKLVAELKFAEWTSDNIMRQPVFMGLREDKSAPEVSGEKLKKLTGVRTLRSQK